MAGDATGRVMTLEQGIEALVRRFDLIIGLLIDGPPHPEAENSAEEKTVRLARIGMRPVEIARLTGRHEGNVNRDLSKARKDGRLPKIAKPRRRAKSRKDRKSRK